MQIWAVTVGLSCWLSLRQLSLKACAVGLSSVNCMASLSPPKQSLEPRDSDVMSSQNAVCRDKHTPSLITVGLYVFSSLHHEHTEPPPLFICQVLLQTALWTSSTFRDISAQ